MVQLFDKVSLENPRLTRDGYMVTEVRAGRTGIQRYLGAELGIKDKEIVRVYRPPDEVFNGDAMASFTSLPITLDHPPEMVTSKNWRQYAVGFTGETCSKDGGFVRVPLALKDASAIDAVQGGSHKQLSFGYTCDLDFTAGTTPEGEQYDAIQRNLRGNHLAIVSAGRAGSDCRIGDNNVDGSTNGGPPMGDQLKTITVDGIPVQTTDAGATVISTLQQRVADHKNENTKLVSDHKVALDAKDAEITKLNDQLKAKDAELGTRDGEIAKLKAETLDAAKLDKLVADRAQVLTRAQVVASDGDYAGKSNPDIRRAAVAKRLGDEAVKDRSDDYVEALFDSLAGQTKNTTGGGSRDPIVDGLRGGTGAPSASEAHNAMVRDMQDAWKQPGGKA